MPREYPEAPIVGVGVVVLRDGEILLVRRANSPGAGKWSVPGGLLRLGETLYEAAVRELREETGLEGVARGVVDVAEYIEEKGGRVRFHYVIVDVLVEPVGGELRAGSDALEAGFFPLKVAAGMDLTRNSRTLVEKLLSGRKAILDVISSRIYA